MPVNRELWREPLSQNHTPSWHCPTCTGGYLALVTNSLHYGETTESKEAHDHPGWGPEWITFRFSALLKCQNENCEEPVSAAGTGQVEVVQTRDPYDFEYIEFYYPKFVAPSPHLFQLPKECPSVVLDDLRHAFTAAWGDYASAATRTRASVERLLDHLKAPEWQATRKNKD